MNQGLLASYTTGKVCFLTTNYGHNEFVELQIGKFIFWGSSWRSAELHGRLVFFVQPMAIYRRWATKHSFLMTQALSYLLSKATGSKYMQLCRNHTHFVRIFSANTWLRSCMRSWCNLPLLRGGERNRWRNLSQKISIQTGLGLRYTMWTQQSVYNKQALLPIYSSVTMPS